MKKYLRIVIPMIVFAYSASISAIVGADLRANVRRVVDAAKRDNWPIVVATSLRADYRMAAYTIGEPKALLATRCADLDLYSTYFDDAGVLHYNSYDIEADYVTEFPNYRPIGAYREEFKRYALYRRYSLGIVNFGRYRWGESGYGYNWPPVNYVVIEDMISGKYLLFGVQDNELWMSNSYGNISSVWWNGGSLYVLADRFETGRPNPVSRVLSKTSELWRFDVSTNEATRLFQTKERQHVYYGPDGALTAISWTSRQLSRTCIIDGESGEILHTVENSTKAIIGRRWVVCTGRHPDGSYRIMLFDMENDWERYEIAVPNVGHYSHQTLPASLALYEPDGD